MENATKALLIAAAVLIAIILIALGVKLLSSTKNVSGQAKELSDSLSKTTTGSTKSVTSALKSIVDVKPESNNNEGTGKKERKYFSIEVSDEDKSKKTVKIGIETDKKTTWKDILKSNFNVQENDHASISIDGFSDDNGHVVCNFKLKKEEFGFLAAWAENTTFSSSLYNEKNSNISIYDEIAFGTTYYLKVNLN